MLVVLLLGLGVLAAATIERRRRGSDMGEGLGVAVRGVLKAGVVEV